MNITENFNVVVMSKKLQTCFHFYKLSSNIGKGNITNKSINK